MAWFRRNRAPKRPKGPLSLRRTFVTPEGVDLQIELGGAGVRAAAFMIDAFAMLILLIIAIPSLMFYRYFRGVVDNHLLNLEQAAERMVPHLMRFAVRSAPAARQ